MQKLSRSFTNIQNYCISYLWPVISNQSHCIEVAQEGVSSRARYNWSWIFSLCWANKKKCKEILCNFLMRTRQYFERKFDFFCPWKPPLKVTVFTGLYCQLAQNQPKFHILFHKNVPAQLLYNDFGCNNMGHFFQYIGCSMTMYHEFFLME